MNFGDCTTFCIECDLAQRLGNDVFVKLSFRVGCDRLGDPDDWAWVKHIVSWTRDFVAQQGTELNFREDPLAIPLDTFGCAEFDG